MNYTILIVDDDSYSAFLRSYSPFFCGVKIVFFPLFITVSRYYDMYTQGGVTYTPFTSA